MSKLETAFGASAVFGLPEVQVAVGILSSNTFLFSEIIVNSKLCAKTSVKGARTACC